MSEAHLTREVEATLHFVISIRILGHPRGSKPPFCPSIYPADQDSLSGTTSVSPSLDCT
jgi:hypothetical protein